MQSTTDFEAASKRAQQASRRRDWHDALHWWNIARQLSPDQPKAHTGASIALRELGRLDEADQLLSIAADRFPKHAKIAMALARLAAARQDWPTAINRWESVRRRFPNNPSAHVGSLNALRGAGHFEEAEALLPAAEAVLAAADEGRFDPIDYLWLALAIAKIRLEWPAVQRAAERIIARSPAPPARAFVELAQALWNLEAVDEAERAAQSAVAIDPTLTEAIIIIAWAATAQGDGDKAIHSYRRLAERNPNTSRWSLKLVELLNWLGQVEEAVQELRIVCQRWPDDPMVQAFMRNFGPGAALIREPADSSRALDSDGLSEMDHNVFQLLADSAPTENEWKRPLIVAAPEREIQVVEVPNAPAAVLIFTGAGDGVSMPLPIFDRYLAALEVTAVYLKDFRRLLFLRGIRSMGDDYDTTLAALQQRLNDLGITRLATIGNCDGAAAAIRYGIELGASLIIAASPTTHIPEGPLPKLAQARNFKRMRLIKNVAREMTDLKSFLETRNHDAAIQVPFNEEDEWESSHAMRIAGAPGVTLLPQQGNPHHAALHRLALSTGNLHITLRKWLRDGTGNSSG